MTEQFGDKKKIRKLSSKKSLNPEHLLVAIALVTVFGFVVFIAGSFLLGSKPSPEEEMIRVEYELDPSKL